MRLLQPIKCIFGSHHRDARQAVHDGQDFKSVCTGCGKPMTRTMNGWVPTDRLPQDWI